jgi:hypothetical protein
LNPAYQTAGYIINWGIGAKNTKGKNKKNPEENDSK